MARLGRAAKGAKRGGKALADALAPNDAKPIGTRGLPLPSPIAGTNLVIADIVMRAAGGLLRNRMEKGLLVKSYQASDEGRAKAEKLVDGRNLATSLALWGASRIATRSPVGLAVVAGGLAAKVLYDRGKRLEGQRRARKRAKPAADSES
jgi:hypothetical protein